MFQMIKIVSLKTNLHNMNGIPHSSRSAGFIQNDNELLWIEEEQGAICPGKSLPAPPIHSKRPCHSESRISGTRNLLPEYSNQ